MRFNQIAGLSVSFIFHLFVILPSAFAVSESYIPENARFSFFINAKSVVKSPALLPFLTPEGVSLDKSLGQIAMSTADCTGDVSFFMTEISPAEFGKAVMDIIVYAPGRVNSMYDRLAHSNEVKTEPVNYSKARVLKVHSINGKTDLTTLFQFVSADLLQCRVAINVPEIKPFIWPRLKTPSMFVNSMKTESSILSLALDAAYLMEQAEKEGEQAPVNRDYKITSGRTSYDLDQEDENIRAIRKNLKALFIRIVPAQGKDLGLIVRARCNNAATRDALFQTVDGLVAFYEMISTPTLELDSSGKLSLKRKGSFPLSTLKHEPKGNDAVFTMTLTERFLSDLAKDPAAAFGNSGKGKGETGKKEKDL